MDNFISFNSDCVISKKSFFLVLDIILVGHKNLNKVPMPRVVSTVEESIVVLRRPHAQTIRPRQWHIARGCPIVEKKFQKGG